MRAITAVAIHRLRANWRAWAALVLLTGLAGGVVMTAVAGARRTENAYPQFLRSTAAADVLVGPAGSGVGGFDFAIATLPGVQLIAPVVGLNCQPLSARGKIDEEAEVVAPLDGRLGRELQRPKMLAGRPPSPDRAGEVMVDQIAARVLGVHVGSVLRLAAMNNDQKAPLRYLIEHVVGVEITSDSIVPVNKLAQTAYIQASNALYRKLGTAYKAFDGDYVKLDPGTTVSAFTAEATHLAREPQYRSKLGDRRPAVRRRRVSPGGDGRASHPAASRGAGHLRAGTCRHRGADARPGSEQDRAGRQRRQPGTCRARADEVAAAGGQPASGPGGRRLAVHCWAAWSPSRRPRSCR